MAKLRLIYITGKLDGLSFEEQVEQACKGGADAVRFACAGLSAREAMSLGARLKEICSAHKVLFLAESRPDIALALDADGVHLGTDDIPFRWAAHILGSMKLIGVSAASLGQATAAAQEGAGYVSIGPLFPPGAETVGVDLLRLVKKRIKIPLIAEGGVGIDTAAEAIATGADGAAVTAGMSVPGIQGRLAGIKEAIINAETIRKETAKNDAR